MHETYLWPFANAVRAGTASIMCSYNRVNGSYGAYSLDGRECILTSMCSLSE